MEFDDLTRILQNIVVAKDCSDCWSWTLEDDGKFTVKALLKIVDEKF